MVFYIYRATKGETYSVVYENPFGSSSQEDYLVTLSGKYRAVLREDGYGLYRDSYLNREGLINARFNQ